MDPLMLACALCGVTLEAYLRRPFSDAPYCPVMVPLERLLWRQKPHVQMPDWANG